MPRCHACGTVYLPAGAGGPAEDCDCGACETAEAHRARREEHVDSGSSDDPREREGE